MRVHAHTLLAERPARRLHAQIRRGWQDLDEIVPFTEGIKITGLAINRGYRHPIA